MKYLKFSIIIFAVIFITQKSQAQQDPMYSQYMFNPLSINPAYAGTADVLSITAISRHQWIGFDGAPTTQTLSAHSPIALNLGGGLSILRDKIGPLNTIGLTANASYNVDLSVESKLYFGLSAGFNNVQFGFNNINISDDDPSFYQDIKSTKPVFGAGLYFRHPKAFVGLSSPDLVASTYGGDEGSWEKQRHFFLSGGAIFTLSDNLKYRPTTMLKYTPNAPFAAELTNTFIIKDFVWLGFTYRLSNELAALLCLQITEQLRFGYSYDFGFNDLSNYHTGSHEIMLSYDFRFGKKYENPRYF